ncbi:MAG: DUF1501 domain-containing protein [Planctomycetes bacterium]|nr:DUF1501 domain-containing protein [Planctomycetota bacterium]
MGDGWADGVRCGRRELVRIGGVSVLAGIGAGSSSRRATAAAGTAASPRAARCIYMLLQGGASHIDLWDPKPLAVAEIRGPFRPIATAVPGIQFGELLEASAAVADRLCVIRSMTHRFSNHIAGTYVTLTGSTAQPDQDREAHSDDFPGPAAVLDALQAPVPGVPRAVSLPNWLSIPGPSNRMPGQYGGFLGAVHDPFVIEGDPAAPAFKPLSLSLADGMTGPRLARRLDLSRRLDSAARLLQRQLATRYDQLAASAYDLVTDGRVRRALDLADEPAASRDRYGRTKIGQSLLLARRLAEAGVQFVAYNAFNQEWDTHGGLLGRYRQIVPPMDRAFGALVADLAERGLLADTLVVNTGEFGRTPTINKDAGRDHWPNAYTTVLAGGGVAGGRVVGASDSKGAEVADTPVTPADVLATMYAALGVPPDTVLRDRLDRPIKLSEGRVLDLG